MRREEAIGEEIAESKIYFSIGNSKRARKGKGERNIIREFPSLTRIEIEQKKNPRDETSRDACSPPLSLSHPSRFIILFFFALVQRRSAWLWMGCEDFQEIVFGKRQFIKFWRATYKTIINTLVGCFFFFTYFYYSNYTFNCFSIWQKEIFFQVFIVWFMCIRLKLIPLIARTRFPFDFLMHSLSLLTLYLNDEKSLCLKIVLLVFAIEDSRDLWNVQTKISHSFTSKVSKTYL